MRGKLGKFILLLGCAGSYHSDLAIGPLLAQPVAKAEVPLIEPATQEEREIQQLLKELTRVGEALVRDVQSADAWRYQAQQADLLLNIAYRSKGAEQDKFLRMAIQTYQSAAIQSPEKERGAIDRLAQVPTWIRQHFPQSDLYIDASLKGIRAEHERLKLQFPTDQARAHEALVLRLLNFAQEYPRANEAVAAIQEAATLSESIGKNEYAIRCYRFLAETHSGTPVARKARTSLRQLGALEDEVVQLRLPLLYPTSAETDTLFDIEKLQGKLVVLFFWSSEIPNLSADFEALKRMTDRFRTRGVEVVYVAMDANAEKARESLQGRLLTGTHVVLKEGLASPFAERYGLGQLPEVFLLSKTGTLLAPALTPAQIEAAVEANLPGASRKR